MSRLLTLTVLIAAMAAPIMAADSPKVLMFVRDGARDLELMLDEETGVMKEMLENAGIEVVVATTSGEPMKAGSLVLEADLKIVDAKASDYDGFILPCMAPAPGSPLARSWERASPKTGTSPRRESARWRREASNFLTGPRTSLEGSSTA